MGDMSVVKATIYQPVIAPLASVLLSMIRSWKTSFACVMNKPVPSVNEKLETGIGSSYRLSNCVPVNGVWKG